MSSSVLDAPFRALGLPPASRPELWLSGPSHIVNVADYFDPAKAGGAPNDLFLMEPMYPVIGVLFYVVSSKLLMWLCRRWNTTGTSLTFRIATVLHNLLLCVYSGWTASIALRLLVIAHAERGYWEAAGDTGQTAWRAGVGMTTYLFYLSKFYEFVDSYILIVKNRPVSWLQSYHHAGAVISVWMGLSTRIPQSMWFTGMNSAVHTIMYFYYALSAANLGHLATWCKPWITRLQLTQFIVGLWAGTPLFLHLFGLDWVYAYTHPATSVNISDILTPAQLACVVFNYIYIAGLVVLFSNFYNKAYIRRTPSGRGARKAKKKAN